MTWSSVTFSTETLLAVLRWRHSEPHAVVAYAPTWYDHSTLRAMDSRAGTELARLGLARGDRLDPDFDDVVGALTRPDHEYFGWISVNADTWPRRYGLLTGSTHLQGFLLLHDYGKDTVLLRSISPDNLLDDFLAHLPQARPASRSGITVDYDEYVAALAPARHDGFAGVRKKASADVRALRDLLRQPCSSTGTLYAATRRISGRRVRTSRPITYVDTHEGRWLLTDRVERGRRWTTARPAARALIAAALDMTAPEGQTEPMSEVSATGKLMKPPQSADR